MMQRSLESRCRIVHEGAVGAMQRSSDFLRWRWLAVSLSVRQARALSSAQHPMEVLLVDQTRGKKPGDHGCYK